MRGFYVILLLLMTASGCASGVGTNAAIPEDAPVSLPDATMAAAAGGGEIGPKADKEGVITPKPAESPDNPRDATHGFTGDGDENGGGPPPVPQENPDTYVKDPNTY